MITIGKVSVGLMKFINGLISGLGTILLLFGVFSFTSNGEYFMLVLGIIFIVLSEIINLYLAKYDNEKEIGLFKQNLLNNIGASYALPVLLFGLYLISKDNGTLVFTLILTAMGVIKTLGLLIKGYYIERL